MITRTLIDPIQYRNHRLFTFIPIPYKLAEWTQGRIKHATYPKSLTVVDPPLATLHCPTSFHRLRNCSTAGIHFPTTATNTCPALIPAVLSEARETRGERIKRDRVHEFPSELGVVQAT